MKIVIDIPDEEYKKAVEFGHLDMCGIELAKAVLNGTPLPQIVDSLKELSKDHRHNYISNSHEERAWRLGIENSIDLLLTEREE